MIVFTGRWGRAWFRAQVYVRLCNMQIRSYKCKMCKDSQIRLYLLLVLVITRKKGGTADQV